MCIDSIVSIIAIVCTTTTTTPAAAATTPTLPPIPAGLPSYFSFGLFNSDPSWLAGSTVPWNTRYQYLAGGANTGGGWATWNSPPGQYALNYITASRAGGVIPAFVYYQILQSTPGPDEITNLTTPATMRAYYDDFKLLLQESAQGGGPVLINIEPDLTGVMQQDASNTADDANLQPTSVAASGHPDLQGYPNTFRGFYQALAHLRDLYAPNVLLGLDISLWGAGDDVGLALRDNPSYDWTHHATRTATYLNSLGPGFQLLFFDPSDRDAAYYAAQGSNRWWDDTNVRQPTFNTMLNWLNTIITQTDKRALLWQVPNGNRVYRSENNTAGHYQDNRPEYFLNATNGRSHISQWANAGVLGVMFGAGVGSQSHYFDNAGDGITNPAPINGNSAVAQYADDDGGFIRLQTAAYYQQGPVTLPVSVVPPPTAAPSMSPTATRTPTGLPTATPPPPAPRPRARPARPCPVTRPARARPARLRPVTRRPWARPRRPPRQTRLHLAGRPSCTATCLRPAGRIGPGATRVLGPPPPTCIAAAMPPRVLTPRLGAVSTCTTTAS